MAKKKKAESKLWVCRDKQRFPSEYGYVVYLGSRPSRVYFYSPAGGEWVTNGYDGETDVPSNELRKAYGLPYLRPGAGPVEVTT